MNSLAQAQPAQPRRRAGIRWVEGVDAHKQSFTYVLLQTGPGGGVQARGELANTPSGYAQLLSALPGSGDGVFAIENARGYGLGLSWYLLAQGQRVYDIPAREVANLRKRRQSGKNDFADAQKAAEVLLDPGCWERRSPLGLPTSALQMQSLERTRESLVRMRVAVGQQIAALAAQPYAVPPVQASLEVV